MNTMYVFILYDRVNISRAVFDGYLSHNRNMIEPLVSCTPKSIMFNFFPQRGTDGCFSQISHVRAFYLEHTCRVTLYMRARTHYIYDGEISDENHGQL